MRLNAAAESRFYKKSRELEMPFGGLLQGHIIETTLARIADSQYREALWLVNSKKLGAQAYRENRSGNLDFYYIESSREIPKEKLIPGQKLTRELAEKLIGDLFLDQKKWHVTWKKDKIVCSEGEVYIQLTGLEEDFQIPVEIHLSAVCEENIVPKTENIALITDGTKKFDFLTYPSESRISDLLIQAMMKLELINDMGVYLKMYDILTSQAVSGRQVIALFEDYSSREPTFTRETRLRQFEGYRNYPYMRKRWNKYRKYHGKRETEWIQVMDCIIHFLNPVWQAFTQGEIFLEDWMPELGRFLG